MKFRATNFLLMTMEQRMQDRVTSQSRRIAKTPQKKYRESPTTSWSEGTVPRAPADERRSVSRRASDKGRPPAEPSCRGTGPQRRRGTTSLGLRKCTINCLLCGPTSADLSHHSYKPCAASVAGELVSWPSFFLTCPSPADVIDHVLVP